VGFLQAMLEAHVREKRFYRSEGFGNNAFGTFEFGAAEFSDPPG